MNTLSSLRSRFLLSLRQTAALFLLGGLVSLASIAQAQIVREKPGKVKSANRRALRDAKHVETPYKDSHLQVSREQLKRGASEQPAPEGSQDLRFRDGAATTAKAARKKKL